jgi:hypothetical protein
MKVKLALLAGFCGALILAVLAGASASAQTKGLSPVYWFEDRVQTPGTEVPGAYSTLLRSDSGVTASMHTSGLIPGNVYTVWWVVFNNPNLCSAAEGGCSPDDVGRKLMTGLDPIGIGILYAGGHIVGTDGKFSFGAHLAEGSTVGCQTQPPFVGACTALSDSSRAEVHLVLHDHGPLIPGRAAEMLGTFHGGCKSYINGATGAVLVQYNLGTYECFSPQASPHKP